MADTEKSQADEIDPRLRMAQRYMQAAHQELADKEAAKPRSQRSRKPGEPDVVKLIPSISISTVYHTIFLMLVVALAAFALAWCYVLLNTMFVAGRIVALPTGVLVFAAASYASTCYLGIIESTANGYTTPENALDGDWQDWFWTLPSTLGVLAISIAVGYAISVVNQDQTQMIILITVWVVLPIIQLSTLENGSPFAPWSVPIISTLLIRPLAWMLFYANSLILIAAYWWLGNFIWRDPPYLSVLVIGAIGAAVLLTYAWLLGQLARWLSLKGD